MGICLDTDAMATENAERPNNGWDGHFRNSVDGVEGGHVGVADADIMNIRNVGKIKFDPPKVPVIFVLGGPGSGKVTHCDTFMQERRGVTHINMMDLLQQYAMGNAMHDFAQLPSKTVTEVLMLEMKMAPAAKVYLISGYPRSMRDVVEYSEKVINGVVLISWRESVLQKQIDYGAKLGHVVLSLAKMELENFFKNVIPVADYFDQSGLLIAVNGERVPAEVYKDFRSAVLDILMTLENQEAILNGVTGMGRGINDIPGSIVSVETAPSQERNITEIANHPPSNNVGAYETNTNTMLSKALLPNMDNAIGNPVTSNHNQHSKQKPPVLANASTSMTPDINHIPPMIWVIGGPGSNKATLCIKAVALLSNWAHFSVGRLLRSLTESNPRINTDNYVIKEALSAGELVSEKLINNVIENNLRRYANRSGVIIDGYPRNMDQVKFFEGKYKQQPYMVLLDCSKLQLGRGRIDDTVSSFRRRLELFREQTLPMLRFMDASNRLQIIDGDTDSPTVQREFEKCIRNFVDKVNSNSLVSNKISSVAAPLLKASSQTDAILQDLESNTAGVVPTISHQVSRLNDHNTKKEALNRQMNGDIATDRNMDFRHMLEEAERYPVDSYM